MFSAAPSAVQPQPRPGFPLRRDKRFLEPDTRALIVACLTEGNGVRASGRVAHVDKNTVMALGLRVGGGCWHLHNRIVRNVRALVIQGDETWSFCYKKEARVVPGVDPAEWGDVYTFIALDAVSKLVIAYFVGKRDGECADEFAKDLRSRLTMVPHLSTDGFPAYPDVIAKHFEGGGSVDYGTAVKHYTHGGHRGPDHRYEPPRDPFVTKHGIFGAPSMDLIGTPHVERYNLTQRHIVGRTRRLCLAFSKTFAGHEAAIALGIAAYNFVRPHSALGKNRTPAMAAGLTDHVWTIAELTEAALAEVPAARPSKIALTMPTERAGKLLGVSRVLPSGRGFLRSVTEAAPPAKGAPKPPAPSPETPPSPPALAVVDPMVDTSGQLDLLMWRPRPATPPLAPAPAPEREPSKRLPLGQLGLFGLDLEPELKK